MTQVRSFSISGLAGRKKIYTRELNRDINIFYGPNGSGKTALLKLLHSALASDPESLLGVRFDTALIDVIDESDKLDSRHIEVNKHLESFLSDIAHGEYFTSSDLERYVHRNLVDYNWSGSRTKGALQKETPRPIQHRYLSTLRLTTDLPDARRMRSGPGLGSERNFDEFFAESVQQLWRAYSNDVLTEVRAAQEQGLAQILRVVLSASESQRSSKANIDREKAYNRVKNFLGRQKSSGTLGSFNTFMKRYESEPMLRSVVRHIDEVENRIEKAMEPRGALEDLVSELFNQNARIEFLDSSIRVKTRDNRGISLARLSSGEKQILRILVETIMSGANPIIIDEPELSLHIDWQRRLLDAMIAINPHAQIIVATHSPEIMENFPDEKIFRI